MFSHDNSKDDYLGFSRSTSRMCCAQPAKDHFSNTQTTTNSDNVCDLEGPDARRFRQCVVTEEVSEGYTNMMFNMST